jgi:tRNA pseudouridine13 synthase
LSQRYLTEDLEGIGGTVKDMPQDFVVEELPLYSPTGRGQHTFFAIRKAGLSTFEAIRVFANALGVPQRSIGYAGLKDARAVTSQVLSVEGVAPDVITGLSLREIQVLWAERHGNRLKIGHLRGNRFTIRIRTVPESALAPCQTVLGMLAKRGVPNWYGRQRFGQRGDSDQLGRSVVKGDAEGFLQRFLGSPHADEGPRLRAARTSFDEGRWEEALELFPRKMADERRALEILVKRGGDYQSAYRSVPKRLRKFLLSAYQSALFNRVLDARLQTLDRVLEGDLAMKHPGRSVFRVVDASLEQARASAFEISPTGPMFGYRMIEASGRQGALEDEILAGEGLNSESFRVGDGIKARGERRALRFEIHEPAVWYDDGIVLRFELGKGSYATAVLAEIMKCSPGE